MVRALYWLGKNIADDEDVVNTLQKQLSSEMKADLVKGVKLLPGWMIPVVKRVGEREDILT